MSLWPRNVYLKEGEAVGRSKDVLEAALEQAHPLQVQSLPPILTLNHLAQYVSVKCDFLREVVGRKLHPYRTFRMRKRSGGYRQIFIPEERLLLTQKWISQFVLSKRPPHFASHAYAPHSSIVKCAQAHIGCQWLIKIDVRQFFESISEIQVYRVFKSIGYQPLVAFELGRLCTRLAITSRRYQSDVWRVHADRSHEIFAYRNMAIGHLPQGAPTSPMLSNLAMTGLDSTLTALANARGCVYTRYSDDMTFSTANSSFSKSEAVETVHRVYAALLKHGLRPKTTKTNIIHPGARKIVLGIVVTETGLRLRKEFRRALECHAYFIRKAGPTSHAARRGFSSVMAMRRYLFGLLTFAKDVDPTFAHGIESELMSVDWPI